MLDKYTCLKKMAARRTDEVIVSTMSVAMPWAELSDGPLDFASVESGMGHAADFAYGLAMARPERRVIILMGTVVRSCAWALWSPWPRDRCPILPS